MVDPDRIHERLGRLDRMLALLEAAREGGESTYLTDLDLRLKTERALQLALQICIDTGAHLIAELGLQPAEDYRGVFESLGVARVIDRDLARRLGRSAGLRNLLVHGYADVEDRLIWEALGHLDDLRAFARAAIAAAER
ncbi:MAG: DUF86 domain-containing protein [Actinomycetota bacterium]|nr:DUF86 domain-containing protein [Actinomycetota bacterium]